MSIPRFEVWSDTNYLSTGKILGMLTNIAQASERIEINGPESLLVAIPSTGDALIAGDRIIRVAEDDGDWTEWRIDKITRTRSDSGTFTQIEALGIKSDMARFGPYMTALQANSERWLHNEWIGLTSTELWEVVWDAFGDDPDTVPYFAKGVVSTGGSTLKFDLVLDWETQGSALIELATVLGMEMEIVAGSTGYTVNLSTAINAGAFAPQVAFRKNERGVRYIEDHGKIGTRIYPRALGDSAFKPTIGDLILEVGLLSPPAPLRSGGLDIALYEDDQLNGLFLESLIDGTIAKIEDSFVGDPGNSTTAAFIHTSTQTPTAGPNFLRVSSTGERLIYIPRASTIEGRMRPVILDRQDIPAISNIFSSGVNPSNSTVAGPSPFVHHGRETGKIGVSFDSAVFFTRPLDIRLSADRPHLSMQSHFYLDHGGVALTFEVFNGSVGSSISVAFPSSTAGGEGSARAVADSRWHDIAVAPGSFDFFDLFGTSTLNARVKYAGISTGASSTTTVVYVDAIQVVNESVPANQIVDGSAPRKLWNAGIELLRTGIENPAKLYDVTAVDLGRLNITAYPNEKFLSGGRVTLFDPGIGITDIRRIKARKRNLLVAGNTVLEFFDA